MKRLGQHFLKNKLAIEKIAEALELESGDFVIEIGAGHGELTEEIRRQATSDKRQGIKIIAVEKDGALARELARNLKLPTFNFQRESLPRLLNENFLIIEGDILKVLSPLVEFLSLKIVNCKLKIVGNIPYYITGHLLRIVGGLERKPKLCVFTIQKEVAERIAATPPKMNRFAASVQFWAEPKIIMRLSRTDFRPPPEVESAVIALTRTDLPATRLRSTCPLRVAKQGGRGRWRAGADITRTDADNYFAAVRMLFAQPRKTILNNLVGADLRGLDADKRRQDTTQQVENISRQSVSSQRRSAVAEKLKKIGVDPNDRPQNLRVEDIIKISGIFG